MERALSKRELTSGTIGIVRKSRNPAKLDTESPLQLAQAAPAKTIETVTVTSSKLGGADDTVHPHRDHRIERRGAIDRRTADHGRAGRT